jgi:hypothetical protein
VTWFAAGLALGVLFGACAAVTYAAWGELDKMKVG